MRHNLREFLVIVVGVLVALFVDALREEYQERRLLTAFLHDVASEVEDNSFALRAMREGLLPEKIRALEGVLAVLADPALAVEDSAAFVRELALSSASIRPWLVNDRYETLRSSGQLQLLRDRNVASALAVFDAAPEVLFPLADDLRGGYAVRVHQILPEELARELSPMRDYVADTDIAGADAPAARGGPDYAEVWTDLRGARPELLLLARGEVAYATAYGYALARYQDEFSRILEVLRPWRSSSP